MIVDPFVLLAPILLLGVIVLLRFVGCHFVHGASPNPSAPGTLMAMAGNGQVALTWGSAEGADSYQITRNNTVLTTVPAVDTSYPDDAVMNGITYYYFVTTMFGGVQYGYSNTAHATPVVLPGRPPGSVWDPNNPLSTNLIGLFLMNEGTMAAEGQPADDTNLADGSIGSHSGSVAPTWEVSDPSIVFHGGPSLTSFIDAGVDALFNDMPTSMITVVAKVFVNALTPGGICEKNDSNQGSQDSGFLFGVDGTGALRFVMELSITNTKLQTNPNAVAASQWVQVAFTWDGTQPNAPASAGAMFVNGVQQANAIATTGSGAFDASKASNSNPFRIGNATYDTIAGSFYGKIAYMAIYKGRLLNPSEMTALDANLPIISG